jgi:hypothetical protein
MSEMLGMDESSNTYRSIAQVLGRHGAARIPTAIRRPRYCARTQVRSACGLRQRLKRANDSLGTSWSGRSGHDWSRGARRGRASLDGGGRLAFRGSRSLASLWLVSICSLIGREETRTMPIPRYRDSRTQPPQSTGSYAVTVVGRKVQTVSSEGCFHTVVVHGCSGPPGLKLNVDPARLDFPFSGMAYTGSATRTSFPRAAPPKPPLRSSFCARSEIISVIG